MTSEFEVDVDTDGDGVINPDLGEQDQYLFSLNCVDVPETIADESATCALTRMIWEMDEASTTTKAKAQVFVGHTGSARIKGGKITGPGNR